MQSHGNLAKAVLLTAALTCACLNSCPARSSPPSERHPYGVLLYGADWCAPCTSEKARLTELKRAAAPLPVQLHWFASPSEAGPVLARLGVTMLPVAIAYDSHGRICGNRQGLLGTEQLRSWARRCDRPRS